MRTKVLFSLLFLAFLTVPLHAKVASSESNNTEEETVVTKSFPYSEVYVFTEDGKVYHGGYKIIIDYLVKGNDVKEYVWSYILNGPFNSLFEDATNRGGSFGYDTATGETPRQIFKNCFSV